MKHVDLSVGNMSVSDMDTRILDTCMLSNEHILLVTPHLSSVKEFVILL